MIMDDYSILGNSNNRKLPETTPQAPPTPRPAANPRIENDNNTLRCQIDLKTLRYLPHMSPPLFSHNKI